MFQPLEGGRQARPQRPVHPALLHPRSPDVVPAKRNLAFLVIKYFNDSCLQFLLLV